MRRDGRRRVEIGTHVRVQAAPEGEHPPVGRDGELDIGLEPAPLIGGEEVLEAILGPFHRAAQVDSKHRGDGDLGRDRPLAPEGAPDVGNDEAQPLVVSAEHVTELRKRPVRLLGRAANRQEVGRLVVLGNGAAGLDRCGDEPGDAKGSGDNAIRRGEGPFDVAACARPVDEIVSRFLMQERRRSRVAAYVQQRGERLVVADDELGGVLCLRARPGRDRSDRLSDVPNLVPREHRMTAICDDSVFDRPGRQGLDAALEVGARQDGRDTGRGARGFDVNRTEPCVSMRAADKRELQGSFRIEVVEVARRSRQKSRVLPSA